MRIGKITVDEIEYLPDVVDTPLWKYLDPDRSNTSKFNRQLASLYEAITNRENYYQDNSPTAFGNPEYEYLCGIVQGIVRAMEVTETRDNDKIIIKKNSNNKVILVIDKIKRVPGYFEHIRENKEIKKELGIGGILR